ncbi:MAG: efflux RND transporter permease subunit [Actinomycetota bacterium]
MIRSIVRASLRFRLLVVAIALGVMGVGIAQLRDAPVDTLPEFTPPYVEIQTEALGLAAEEVEQLITVPMEADLLNGVEGIDVLRSESLPGLSSITLVFENDFDLYTGRQLVQERLTQMGAAAMPNVSKPPRMLQPYSSSSRVLMFSLASDKVSPIDKSVIARWTLQPRLLGVPGVANVAIWGFRDRQLQVLVDPERLRDRDVTLKQVVDTAGNAQISTPLSHLEGSTPGTGGFIETPQQRLGVRNVFDKLRNPAELGKVPVDDTGGRLRLGEVANVVEDHQPLIGDAIVNDGDGLLLVVEKFPGANTLEVTEGVEEALDELKPGLAGMEPDTSVFRPATFLEDAIANVTLTLVIAGVLLALAIAAFLFQWRSVLIALFTVPLSLIAAGLVLHLLGETFNALSFAGLAVALAVVVDDAVVGAENVGRRLRRLREAGSDRLTADIVRTATHEMRSPLTYATLIALLAIVPVAVMEGRPGAFFEPFVLAYALTVAVAMIVALTVTPALSLLLFSTRGFKPRESPLLRWLAPRYASALSRLVRSPRAVIIGAAAVVVVAGLAFVLANKSVIPSFKDRDVLVRLNAAPGTSNTRMADLAKQVGRELRSVRGVDNVGAHVGRAVTGDRRVDVNSGDVWVSIDSNADYDATVTAIEDAVARVRGVRSDLITYSEQKIRDVGALREGENPATGDGLDVLTGSDRPLTVRVYGENLATLRRQAERVRQLMSQVDGVFDPRVERRLEQPNVEIEVDLDKARRAGIKPGDVRRAEATMVQGLLVGSVFDEQKVFEVVVQGTPNTRRNISDIRNLLLDRPGGGHVRLGEVADVRVENRPISIQRESVSRYLDVEAEVSGRSLDSVAGDIEDRLQSSVFPIEYHAEVRKRSTSAEINRGLMIGAAIAVAIAAFLLMQAALRSWRLAAIAFLTLPVALAGGALAGVIDGEFSLASLVGFLALLGLAARQGLLSLHHFQGLERYEGEVFGADLVRRGALERLAPILATASALALVALVLVILGSRSGLEILNPMAWVVLGGVVTTTLVSLFVLPALYLRFGDGQPTLSPDEELMHTGTGVRPEPSAVPAGAGAAGVAPSVQAKDGGVAQDERRPAA